MAKNTKLLVVIILCAVLVIAINVFRVVDKKIEENNIITKEYKNVTIIFKNIPFEKNVTLDEKSKDTTDVKYIGDKDIIEKLNIDTDNFNAYVDLNGLEDGTYTLPVKVREYKEGLKVELSVNEVRVTITSN